MMTARTYSLADRLAAASSRSRDVEGLARAVFDTVGERIPFHFGCFATTDPASEVIARAVKSHPLPMGSEQFAAAEYGTADLNQFAEIARRPVPVGALWLDTGGHPERCRRMSDYMTPSFGFSDELRMACRSRGTTWAVLAVYRRQGSPFTQRDVEELAGVGELIADRVRLTLVDTARRDADADVAAVVIVDADNRVSEMSTRVSAQVEELGGWNNGALPDNLLAVVALARSRDCTASTRVRGKSGRWLALRATPLDGPGSVVVTIDPAPAAALGDIALAARGLTAREQDVAKLVLQGAPTKDIAASLHLSPNTVQDHLKSVFQKLGVASRREMIARLVVGEPPR